MLLNGVNHVAILTHDTDRLAAFYREVFDAEIGSHLEEFDGAVQLTFIRIGQTAELNVFQVAATPKPTANRRCSGGAGSTISGCKPRRSTRLTRSGTG
jgi:catechol 2,3-dioxygenase-like lactoylglutathione lyase family enzyme